MKIIFNNLNFVKNTNIINNTNIKHFAYQNTQCKLPFKGDSFERQTNAFDFFEDEYKNTKKELILLKQKKDLSKEEKEKLTMELVKIASDIFCLNEILKQSAPENYEEDCKILFNYYLAVKTLEKEKGFDGVVGYDDIKEKLNTDFVMKVMGRARTSQKVDVPNAFLLYGPTGCGKTLFATALAEQSLSYVQNIDAEGIEPEEFIEVLKNVAQEAENKYIESQDEKKRTILVVNEFDVIANKFSPIIDELVDFMKDCSEKYKCTLFLTSNYPCDIDERILDRKITSKKIAISPSDYETARGIIKQQNAKSKIKLQDIEIDVLCDFLFSNPNLLYSNADFINIFNVANSCYETPDLKAYLDVAKNQAFPTVSKNVLRKFEKEKALLGNNN